MIGKQAVGNHGDIQLTGIFLHLPQDKQVVLILAEDDLMSRTRL